MKIASFVSQMKYSDENIARLESIGELIQSNANKISEEELIEKIKDIDYIIAGSSGVKTFSKEVFAAAKNLKIISVLGSGVDYIDLEAARAANVLITNAKGANAQSVAEHTFGMALNLSKKITESHIALKDRGVNFEDFGGVELYGKTIGIVGLGEIGSRVASIAKGFNMDIVYYKREMLASREYKYVQLNELFAISDLIVVTVPGNNSTAGMIGRDLLSKMKDTAILVSTSRESVIDEAAILEKLASGKIQGYGFDADINEPPNPDFYNYPNVLITPHTAFFTAESEVNVENTAVDNIVKFHQGIHQNVV
jgi:D-3-phosphoglycerate dehydrogenase